MTGKRKGTPPLTIRQINKRISQIVYEIMKSGSSRFFVDAREIYRLRVSLTVYDTVNLYPIIEHEIRDALVRQEAFKMDNVWFVIFHIDWSNGAYD